MKLSKKTIDLICDLEYIIGSECYNPRSVNGWTGEEGCYYRYPIWYKSKDGKDLKSNSTIHDANKDSIPTMKYKFGTNELYIGDAIVKVLEYIEKSYGINFDELVKGKNKLLYK